jgi:helicase-like protein
MRNQWTFPAELLRMGGAGANKIGADDGARQERTVLSILQDMSSQPGMVLADEVGMGKTYVALAVVASAVLAERSSARPVVVMVPPGLAQKWPREWDQFKAVCCVEPSLLDRIRDEYVHTPTDFFRALDRPRRERPHIIWMTTGCFSRGLSDPWTKLALIRLARSRTRMDDETKKTLAKWATALVRLKSRRQLTPEIVESLLHADIGAWRGLLIREQILSDQDADPVSQYLLRHQHQIDWTPLITVLRGEAIPGRRGAVSEKRLQQARDEFNRACQQVYWDWLATVRWRAPLFVLDEAHHAKNDGTVLASLLRSGETQKLIEGEQSSTKPLLWEKFDRMLFLTATPFQLGHHELIRVLRSFAAAKWTGLDAPARTRDDFLGAVDELESRLNENRLAARRLDKLWGKLAHEAVRPHRRDDDPAIAATNWWDAMQAGTPADAVDRELMAAINECRKTKALAENDPDKPWSSLRTWVVRHNRSGYLPNAQSQAPVARRLVRAGKTIAGEGPEAIAATVAGNHVAGLPISGDAALPFLLAARAQGELAYGSAKGRAFFAEGLCSSYEAFHHTRDARGDPRDIGDDGVERGGTATARDSLRASLVPASWYEDQVAMMIPSKQADDGQRFSHPKIHAVVRRTISLWLSGEKVLLFCFYRETAKALRAHIGREVENATIALAGKKLGLPASRGVGQIRDILERIARRLSNDDSPFHRVLIDVLREPLESDEFAVLRPHLDKLAGLLAGYVRSPSFIARYIPLDIPEVREALVEGSKQVRVARAGADALAHAIANDTDASSLKMAEKIREFLWFSKDLADQRLARNAADDENIRDPLANYLEAVAVYVSPRRTILDDEGSQANDSEGTYRVLQPVRMVFGETKPDARQRLMLAFNSPMFPEILISSAVLGEGVDLHRFCRHVIHHDLCWNPSTLEQRTGRLDRIRCKAETSMRPIVVYEPYLGGSADEKMFRVVQDRERWFQIVMGQKFEFDEAASDELANRIPLPANLAASLIFDLRRYRPHQSS